MQQFLLNLVIMFVLRQLAKFGTQTDWAKVKADLGERVRQLVPGEWLDDDAVLFVNQAIDAFAFVCADTADLKAIIDCLARQDYAGAYEALKVLIGRLYQPTDAIGKAVAKGLAKAKVA